MKIIPLSIEERANSGFTHKAVLTYADLTTAGTSQAIQIYPESSGSFAAGTVIEKVGFNLVTQFSGGSASALTVSAGDSGSATQFGSAISVLNGATPVTWSESAASTRKAYTATDGLKLTFTSTGANVNTLTAGELHCLFAIQALDKYKNN